MSSLDVLGASDPLRGELLPRRPQGRQDRPLRSGWFSAFGMGKFGPNHLSVDSAAVPWALWALAPCVCLQRSGERSWLRPANHPRAAIGPRDSSDSHLGMIDPLVKRLDHYGKLSFLAVKLTISMAKFKSSIKSPEDIRSTSDAS